MTKLRTLVVLGGIVSTVALSASPAAAIGPLHRQTLRVSVPGKVTALVVRGEVGDITVVRGATTRIVAVEGYNLAAPVFTHTLKDGVLRVAAHCPESRPVSLSLGLNNCATDLTISVPRNASLDADGDVGDIAVNGLSGDERVRTGVGDIELVVPTGTYAVKVHSDIGATHVTGITVQPDAAHSIHAVSDVGDVRITGK